jgi:uncharacterized protein
MSAKILDIDIECAPAKAHVWGLFNQNIGLTQVLEDPRIMGFGAKWRGSKRVIWKSEYHDSRSEMLAEVHALLDAADVVVHYNGNSFDTPWIQGELAVEGLSAPSPFKQIDLYRVAKKNMRFISHKLQYVAGRLINESKMSHAGHQMWVDALEGDEETKRKAWAQMRRYCIQDVRLLEPLSDKLQAYFPASVNFAVYSPGDEPACQKCGGTDLERRGIAYTAQRAFPQYRCRGCGGWTRDSRSSWSIQSVGVTR